MAGRQLARSTALVAGLTLGSQVLGLLRDVTVAAVFGVDATLRLSFGAYTLSGLIFEFYRGDHAH